LTLTNSKKQLSLRLILPAILLCLLAWTIFVVNLDYRSMWIDEHYSWRISRLGPLALVQDTAGDVHPPLYYLWLWAWMTWTGSEDLFMMRLTAAIPAVLAVAFVIRLGRGWFGSAWVGLGAGVFLATSGIFINYARELRMYALIVLLICVSWWLLGRLLRGKPRGVLWYGLSLAAMAYTFYFSAFVVLAQFIYAGMFYRRQLSRLFHAAGLALLLFLPWLPVFIGQLGTARSQSGDTTNTPIIGKFLGTTPTSLKSISEFVDIYSAGQAAFVAALVGLALLLTYGNSPRFRRWLAAISLWFFLVTVLFFALNLVIPIYGLRYVLVIIPALALLVGVGVYRMPRTAARLGLIALVGVTGILTHEHSFQVPRAPNREMLRTIAVRYLPGDRIWYDPPLGARGSNVLGNEANYHLQFDAPGLSTDWFVWDAPRDYEDVTTTPRVWDARPYWIPMIEDARPALENGRTISEQFEFEGYTIRLYEAPPADGQSIIFSDVIELLPGPLDRTVYLPGDMVVTKTWWRAVEATPLDYSYSLILRRADGMVISQVDDSLRTGGMPTPNGLDVTLGGAIKPTSQWQPDDPYQLATPNIILSADLPAGAYEAWIGVYFYQDPERLPVSSSDARLVDEAARLAKVAAFTVG